MTGDQRVRLGEGVEPGPLTPGEMDEFLQRPLIARLATVRPDGAPYINPLWFEWDGSDFWLLARRRSAYVEHLRANPRVCLSVASDELPYTRVTAIGRAEVANPDGSSDVWLPLARRLTRRYVGGVDDDYAERTAQQSRWLIRVVPEETITWRGGGWARHYTQDEQ